MEGGRVLVYRQTFSGERGFRRLQRNRLDDPPVGRNRIAFFQDQDIAGDDFGGGDVLHLARPQHTRVRRRHAPQSGDGFLGLGLLGITEARVEQYNGQNGQGLIG